jgi:hypothetical protein
VLDVLVPKNGVPCRHGYCHEQQGYDNPAPELEFFARTLFVFKDNYMIFSEKHYLSSMLQIILAAFYEL